jgi:hypothetical protein
MYKAEKINKRDIVECLSKSRVRNELREILCRAAEKYVFHALLGGFSS